MSKKVPLTRSPAQNHIRLPPASSPTPYRPCVLRLLADHLSILSPTAPPSFADIVRRLNEKIGAVQRQKSEEVSAVQSKLVASTKDVEALKAEVESKAGAIKELVGTLEEQDQKLQALAVRAEQAETAAQRAAEVARAAASAAPSGPPQKLTAGQRQVSPSASSVSTDSSEFVMIDKGTGAGAGAGAGPQTPTPAQAQEPPAPQLAQPPAIAASKEQLAKLGAQAEAAAAAAAAADSRAMAAEEQASRLRGTNELLRKELKALLEAKATLTSQVDGFRAQVDHLQADAPVGGGSPIKPPGAPGVPSSPVESLPLPVGTATTSNQTPLRRKPSSVAASASPGEAAHTVLDLEAGEGADGHGGDVEDVSKLREPSHEEKQRRLVQGYAVLLHLAVLWCYVS